MTISLNPVLRHSRTGIILASSSTPPFWQSMTDMIGVWDFSDAANLTLSGSDITGVTDLTGNGHDLSVVLF